MLELQMWLVSTWLAAADRVRALSRGERDGERGEVTATTAIIVLLVVAALAAGAVIASKITGNADNVPSP